MAKKDRPRWENDRWIVDHDNAVACIDCSLVIGAPDKGTCKAFTFKKPGNVYFDGAPCPKKQVRS